MKTKIERIAYTPETGPRKGLPCLYIDGKERIDYEKLYYRVEHLHPELTSIVEYIRNLVPAYMGEYKALLKQVCDFPEQEKIIRQRLFDISLRFVLIDAVYYYEHYKINIEDAFQSCSEALLQTINIYIERKIIDSTTFISYYNLRVMSEFATHHFRYMPNKTMTSKIGGSIYAKFLQHAIATLGTKKVTEWNLEDVYHYFRSNNILTTYRVSTNEITLGCLENVELTEDIIDSIPQTKIEDDEVGIPAVEKLLPPPLFEKLKDREKYLLSRMFCFPEEKPPTLQTIGNELGISKERVRQLEVRLLRKLKRWFSMYRNTDLYQYKQ